MRVVVTGGAGFIGRAVVARLAARGDRVVALVRDPDRARHLAGEHVELVQSSLDDPARLEGTFLGADAAIHGAGDYRVGIHERDRPAMWDANVGTTERVLDAAIKAGVPRILYISTLGVMGNTRGRLVDETYRRDATDGFLGWYDETKFRAHEVAEARIAAGAPIVIAMPSQVYGPDDHSHHEPAAGAGTRRASSGTVALGRRRRRLGARPRPRRRDRRGAGRRPDRRGVLARAASAAGSARPSRSRRGSAGRRPPLLTVPTVLLRLAAPINDAARRPARHAGEPRARPSTPARA